MRRRVLNFAAIVSLLLCLASAGLWVRSYWQSDRLSWEWSGGDLTVGSSVGRMEFWLLFIKKLQPQPLKFDYYHARSGDKAEDWANQRDATSLLSQFGFYFDDHSNGSVSRTWAFTLPWWIICVVFSPLPIIWIKRFRRPHKPHPPPLRFR